MTRTIQLRRYDLLPGGGDEFVAWWASWIPEVRPEYGFMVEVALLDADADQFTWAVSFEGTEEEFLEAETRYNIDPRRLEAFTKAPPLQGHHISFVTSAL